MAHERSWLTPAQHGYETTGHGDQIGDTFQVRCPLCHDSNMHPQGRPAEQGEGREYRYRNGAPHGSAYRGGAEILMTFQGECGHGWSIHLGHHKGESFLYIVAGASTKGTS